MEAITITNLNPTISNKDFDVDAFVRAAIADQEIRDEIVRQMIHNPGIMVYYHCFYVVSKASQEQPDLFYQYWDDIAGLLGHPNSYHRDFGLTVLANLTRVDVEDKFAGVFEEYMRHLDDVKFMTGVCCVRNTLTIIRNKGELKEAIVGTLLEIDRFCTYPEKQKGLLKFDVLEILDEVYDGVENKAELDKFIRTEVNSVSPKTRKKAKELVQKYAREISRREPCSNYPSMLPWPGR